MLLSLTIKNFTLIDSEEIELGRGLNILSGETGAGKSIILGALSLSLGGKSIKDAVRNPDQDAYIEAVFSVDDEKKEEALRALDIEPYDNQVILSRRLTGSRSISKINGESVPSNMLKEAGELLIDIYGQNEHQSLLKKSKHMEIVDQYGGNDLIQVRNQVRDAYRDYEAKNKELIEAKNDDKDREKDLMFLMHEAAEIEAAALKPGEDEEVESRYKKLKNSEKIMEALNSAYNCTEGDGQGGALALIGHALSELSRVSDYDERVSEMYSVLTDAEGVLSDFNRDLKDYMADDAFDEAAFRELEDRLDTINDLKNKYGNTIEAVLETLSKKQEKIAKLQDYDKYLADLEREVEGLRTKYLDLAAKLTELRRQAADRLSKEVSASLLDLNFSNTEFKFELKESEDYSANGLDQGEFMISLNLGEPLKPLRDVASGGELSRISLAIKTAVTEQDGIDTLIFDEIDAGISGRTAQKVAERLNEVSKHAQVICITHLPQIAAMADTHFVVEKTAEDGETRSSIRKLSRMDRINELSRMIGSESISETTKKAAEELLDSADALKKK